MPVCPNCGAQQIDGAIFCDECGTRLVAAPAVAPPPVQPAPTVVAAHCPSCGAQVMPGEMFCQNCGTALGGVAPAPAQPFPYHAPPPQAAAGPQEALICPSCGTSLEPGSMFCDMCGAPITGAAPSFAAAPQVAYPPPLAAPPVGVGGLHGRLVVQSTNTPIPFPPGRSEIVIGREDPVNNIFPDIDLTDHGGDEGGVSRRHARIYVRGEQLFIEDLNSTNYTYVNQEKLTPGQPHPLNNGDEIRLGKVRLNFYA